MMPEPVPFPHHLLQQPPERQFDYFKTVTVAHPPWTQADQAFWNALREPAGSSLIFVVGPTGVGKTTLLTQIEKRLIDRATTPGDRSTSHIPSLKLDAVSPAWTQFKWGDYYQRALLLLQEPHVEYALDYRRQVPVLVRQTVEQTPLPWKGRTDTATLRLIFEQALKHRKPYAILIDEAEHIAKAARGSKLLDQLDHLKSLAIMSQVVHVLVGTYDLMVFRNLSAQLSRRSIDVHFSRYQATNEADVRACKSVLWSFQRNLPLEEEPDLLQHWKYCYERTIGCVGVLKDWFTRALAEALEQGEKTLSHPLLEQHALSVDRCGQMVSEAVAVVKGLSRGERGLERVQGLAGVGNRDPAAHMHAK